MSQSHRMAVPLDEVDLSDLDRFARNEALGAVRHAAPRGTRALEPRAERRSRVLVGDPARGHLRRRPRPGDLHVDAVRQPRGGRRRPDGRSAGRCWRPTASRHRALRKLIAARVQPAQPDAQLRGLPARPDQGDGRRGPRRTRVRLRREDQRRLPHPGARATARRARGRHRAADRLGQRDGRQHRPGLHRVPGSTARRASSTSTCRSGRPPRRRSSSTAASSSGSARAATART